MTVALSLPTLRLSDDESTTLTDLLTQLALYQPRNQVKADYYEAKTRMEDLRIAIPPSLSGLQCCVGWPSVAVDAIEERLDFEKWSTPTEDDYGLAEVYAANDLDVESGVAHLDSLIYGTSFVGVSTGLDGEADPLVTVESPKNMTATIDPRSRRTQKALKVIHDDEGQIVGGDLFLQGQTVALECRHGAWLVVNRDVHNLSRVPVAQIVNRPRSGDRCGRSEITRVVRSLTQSGMRTLAASEIAREYYAAPQRFILGARESAFVDSDGNPLPAWKSYIGRLLALERDENGELPEIKEFKGAGLESFFGMMRMLTQLMSSELAVPASYLGFTTENPPSADAIAALEGRLVKRVERRQKMFGRAWTEVARLALMVRDGTDRLPEGVEKIRPKWRDASTPTQAAMADAATKLTGGDNPILPARSRVTWDMIGIPLEDQDRLEEEHRAREQQATVTSLVAAIRGPAAAVQQDSQVGQLASQTVDNTG